MEKPSKSKGRIMLKFLQKAATFSLTNHPPSPRAAAADKRPAVRGFSGPITSIIPPDARHKNRSDVEPVDEEPRSPKVTCIGQVKCKKKAASAKKKVPSSVSRTFSQRIRPSSEKEKKRMQQPGLEGAVAAAPPALDRMRKFSSGRDTFSNFDWENVAVEEKSDDYDEKRGKLGGGDETSYYHSAPLVMGGGPPAFVDKEEVSLWRRRPAMTAPLSLKVNIK